MFSSNHLVFILNVSLTSCVLGLVDSGYRWVKGNIANRCKVGLIRMLSSYQWHFFLVTADSSWVNVDLFLKCSRLFQISPHNTLFLVWRIAVILPTIFFFRCRLLIMCNVSTDIHCSCAAVSDLSVTWTLQIAAVHHMLRYRQVGGITPLKLRGASRLPTFSFLHQVLLSS